MSFNDTVTHWNRLSSLNIGISAPNCLFYLGRCARFSYNKVCLPILKNINTYHSIFKLSMLYSQRITFCKIFNMPIHISFIWCIYVSTVNTLDDKRILNYFRPLKPELPDHYIFGAKSSVVSSSKQRKKNAITKKNKKHCERFDSKNVLILKKFVSQTLVSKYAMFSLLNCHASRKLMLQLLTLNKKNLNLFKTTIFSIIFSILWCMLDYCLWQPWLK